MMLLIILKKERIKMENKEIEEIMDDIKKFSRKLNDLILISAEGKANQSFKYFLIINLAKVLEKNLIERMGKGELKKGLNLIKNKFPIELILEENQKWMK